MTTTTITDNTSIARRHKDSNKRGPSTCDRACAVIQSRLAGTTAVHVARTEAPSRTRLATCAGQVHATRHSNRRVTIQASARGNARPPQSQYPRATRERAAWRRCRTGRCSRTRTSPSLPRAPNVMRGRLNPNTRVARAHRDVAGQDGRKAFHLGHFHQPRTSTTTIAMPACAREPRLWP